MIRFKKVAASAVVVLLSAYSPLSNASIQLPGIPESGTPNFMNDAQVRLFDIGADNYLFVASNAGSSITYNNDEENVSVSSNASHPAHFLLTAQFSSHGTYVANSGNLSISGEIPFTYEGKVIPNLYISGDLLTAKLDNFSFNENTLGFSTAMTSGFGMLFSTGYPESVYLSATGIASALGFGTGSLIATASPIQASAITTVPIPAAGWLIGSAFGLFTLLRRNRLSVNPSC